MYGLHTIRFAGVAFQVCTTNTTIYNRFIKFDVIYEINLLAKTSY